MCNEDLQHLNRIPPNSCCIDQKMKFLCDSTQGGVSTGFVELNIFNKLFRGHQGFFIGPKIIAFLLDVTGKQLKVTKADGIPDPLE